MANATLQRGAGGLGFDSVIIPNEDIEKCSLKGHCFYHEGVVIRAYFEFMKENASCPRKVPSVGDMLVPKSTSRNIEEMPRSWTQPTGSIALVIGFAYWLGISQGSMNEYDEYDDGDDDDLYNKEISVGCVVSRAEQGVGLLWISPWLSEEFEFVSAQGSGE